MANHGVLAQFWELVQKRSDDFLGVSKLLDGTPSLDINTVHYTNGIPQLMLDAPILGDTDITPLHLACSNHNEEVANVLLGRNALQTSTRHSKVTPLHCTIFSGLWQERTVDMTKALMRRIPDPQKRKEYVDRQDYLGQSALHLAIRHPNYKLVKLLIEEENADTLQINNAGQTCLHIAAQFAHRPIMSLLLSLPEIDKKFIQREDKNGNTAWDIANGSAEPKYIYGGFRWGHVQAFMQRELSECRVPAREALHKYNPDFSYYYEWLNSVSKTPGFAIRTR